MSAMTATATATATAPLPARVGPVRAVQQTCSLAWRTLVQVKHNPFELMDFSVQPIMFLLLFVYVFGGAIGGSTHDYLQYVLPGIIVQNSLFTTLNTATGLSTDLDKGFSSRLRALPIARFAPLAGRIIADVAKQAWAVALLYGVGTALGFRPGTSALAVLAGAGLVLVCTLAFAWAFVWIGVPGKGADLRLRGAVPAHLHQRRVRPHRHHARLAAGVLEGQPRDAAGRGDPRPDGRRPGRGARGRGAAVRGGLRGGVRAARGPRLQAPGVRNSANAASSVAGVTARPRWKAAP